MAGSKDYQSGKPAVFENLKVYVGALEEELVKSVKYFLYLSYGKHWREGSENSDMKFLQRSITLHSKDPERFIADIKKLRKKYRFALYRLLQLVSNANPYKSDDYALKLVTSFIKDMDIAVNVVLKDKTDSFRTKFEMDAIINEIFRDQLKDR